VLEYAIITFAMKTKTFYFRTPFTDTSIPAIGHNNIYLCKITRFS